MQTSEDDDECMTLSCCCPKKSTALQSLQLDVPTMKSKSWGGGTLCAYKFQILHEINNTGKQVVNLQIRC